MTKKRRSPLDDLTRQHRAALRACRAAERRRRDLGRYAAALGDGAGILNDALAAADTDLQHLRAELNAIAGVLFAALTDYGRTPSPIAAMSGCGDFPQAELALVDAWLCAQVVSQCDRPTTGD